MSLSLGSVFVKLDADTQSFLKGFAGAAQTVEKFAKEVKKAARDVAEIGTALTAIGAGALALASTVDRTAARSMLGLKEATTGLAVEVSRTLLPAVKTLTEDIRAVADWFANLSPHTKQLISQFAQFAATIGLASLVLGKVAGLVNGVAGAVSALASGIAAVGVGALIEVVLVIGLIAGAVVLLHKAWRQNWGGIADYIKSFLAWFEDGWASTMGGLGKLIDGLTLKFLDALDKITEGAQEMFEALGWSGAGNAMKGLKEMVRTLREDVAQKGVSGVVKSIVKDFVDGGKAAGEGFVAEFKLMMKELGLDIDHMFDKGPKKSHSGKAPAKPMGHREAANIVGGGMQSEGYDAAKPSKRMGGATASTGGGYSDTEAKDASHAFWDGIDGGIAVAIADSQREGEAIAEQMHVFWDNQLDLLGAGIMNGVSKLSTMLGSVGDLMQSAIQGFQSGGIWGALIAMILELLSKFRRWGEVLDAAEGAFSKLMADLDGPLSMLVDVILEIIGVIQPLADLLHNILGPIIRSIADGLSLLGSILGFVIAVLSPLLKFIGDLLGALVTAVHPIITALKGLFDALGPIFKLFGDLAMVVNPLVPIFKLLGYVFSMVGLTILGTMNVIGIIINAIQDIFDANAPDVVDTAKIQRQMKDMWEAMGEPATKMEDSSKVIADSATDTALALTGLKTTADEVSGGLRNVPSGYKVALARLNATDGGGWDVASMGKKDQGITIEKMVIVTNDPEKFGKALVERGQREAYRATGNKYADVTAW